jgi:RsiW-degrading membrane proteinase PrsW (M82 family)
VTTPRRSAPAQIQSGRLRALRSLPAVLTLVGLLAIGAWRLAEVLHSAFAVYPVASGVAVGLFTLYAVPFVLLLRTIDYLERQPTLLKLGAFAWGGAVATTAAISGGAALEDLLAKSVSPAYAAQWGPAVASAGLEEVLKLLGVVIIALIARRSFTSVIDGFVYGALVGLGFQVVEDVVFAVSAVALNGAGDRAGPVVVTFVVRGFIGGLWSHTLFTGLSGAGVAYGLVRTDKPLPVRVAVAVSLFAAAWGGHFLWNSPWLSNGFGFGPLGALAAVLIKGIPVLLVGIVLLVAAERREADYYSALLASVADPRIATEDEIRALVSPRRRFAARRRARTRLGWAGGRAVRRLQRAQAQLAVALSRDPGAEVVHRRRDVLGRRHQLVALSLAGGPANRRTAALATSALVIGETLLVGVLAAGVALLIRLMERM